MIVTRGWDFDWVTVDECAISGTDLIYGKSGTDSAMHGRWITDEYGIQHLITNDGFYVAVNTTPKAVVSYGYKDKDSKLRNGRQKPLYTQGRHKKGGRKLW